MSIVNKKLNYVMLILLLFAMFSAFIIGGGFWWYHNQKKIILRNWQKTLESTAYLQRDAIVEWRQEKMEGALSISRCPIFLEKVAALLKKQTNSQEQEESIIPTLKLWLKSGDYNNIYLLDKHGSIVLSVDATFKGKLNKTTIDLCSESLDSGKVIFSDLYLGAAGKAAHIDLIAPLIIPRGYKKELLGTLVFIINPGHFLYPLFQNWPNSNPTAETLLVQQEGERLHFLTPLRHRQGQPLTFTLPLDSPQLPAARALKGQGGMHEGRDYRGVPVLAVTSIIPGTPWHMVSKVDKEEVFADLHREGRLIGAGVIALVLLVGASMGWTLTGNRKGHYKELFRLENERRALLAHFEYLVKYANDIILLADENLKIIEVNDRACEAYGYNREELLNLHTTDLRDSGNLAELTEILRRLEQENGLIYEAVQRRKDGTLFPVEVSTRILAEPGRKYYQAIIRDISERKQAEKALQAERNLAQSYLEVAEVMMLVLNPQGEVVLINRKGCQILGYQEPELIGKNWFDACLIPQDRDRVTEAFRQIISGNREAVKYFENPVVTKGGEVRFIAWHNTILTDGEGSISGLLSCGEDITGRKRRIERQERFNRLKEDLLSSQSFRERLKIITDGVVEIFAADFARIWLTKPKDLCATGCIHAQETAGVHVCRQRDRCLHLMASSGRYTHIDSAGHRRVPVGNYKIGMIAAGAYNKLLCNDVTRDPIIHDHDWAKDLGLVSFAGYRLLSPEKRTLGVLALFSRHPISPDEDVMLEGIAGTTAQVIQIGEAEEVLRASEEKYRSLFEQAVEGVFQSTPEGRYLSVNPAMARILGYATPQEMIRGVEDIGSQIWLHPEKREEMKRLLSEHGTLSNYEIAYRRPDGTSLWVSENIRLRHDANGQTYYEGFVVDITKRKRAEEELHKWAHIFDHAHWGVVVGSSDGKTLEMTNPAFAKMHGYKVEELIGRPVLDIVAPESRPELVSLMSRLHQIDHYTLEAKDIRKDGTIFPVLACVSAVKNDHGDVLYHAVNIQDITGLKQAEEDLRIAAQKWRTTFDAIGDGVCLLDGANEILQCNQAMTKFMGRPFTEIIGRKCWEVVHQTDRPIDGCPCMRSKNTKLRETMLLAQNDRWFRITVDPILKEDGVLMGVVHIISDVTLAKQMEEKVADSLRQLKKTLSCTVQVLSATVETRDPYTAGHQRRVGELASAIAEELGFPREQLEGMQVLGYLHDIGKIAVPAEILSRPGKLSEMEFNIIKNHSQVGYDILKDMEFPWPVARAVLQHHERLDGSGYPQGLTEPDIIIEARILAVADVVEAMASHRPYRASLGIDAALEEITKNKNKFYDSDAVDACVKIFTEKRFHLD